MTRVAHWLHQSGWRLLPLLALPLYLLTFASIPRLRTTIDVIGEADAGAYALLVEQWSLRTRYGDARKPRQRTLGDVAQEHKIKHVLTPLLYAPVAGIAREIMPRLGVRASLVPMLAVKLPGAIVGAASIAILGLILLLLDVPGPRISLVCAVFLFAPGQWIYAALPESWPLSGLLALVALWSFFRWPSRSWPLAVIAGIAMMNCIVLGLFSALPIVAAAVGYRPRPRRWSELLPLVAAPLVAVVVWGGGLGVMGRSDPELRPDRVLDYLRFFPSLLPADNFPRWSFTMLRVSLEQWILTPLASYQPNTQLVGWGLGETFRYSAFGKGSLVMVLVLWLTSAAGWLRSLGESDASTRRVTLLALFTATLWLVLHQGSAYSMFLYAPVLLPMTLIIIALLMDKLPPAATAGLAVPCLWLMLSGVLQLRLVATLAS